MRKILLLALVALMLVGCRNVNTTREQESPDKLFKDEIERAINIENVSNKMLMSSLTSDTVVDAVSVMSENKDLSELYVSYGYEEQGIGTDDKGNKIFCYKIPVQFDLDGEEKNIKAFVDELYKIPTKVSVSKFEITNKEEKFHLKAIINFLGDIKSSSVSSKSGPTNYQKNEVEVHEKENITLRDFDVNLTLRPSNSDSSAIVLGLSKNDSGLYNDENKTYDVKVNFSKDGGKFYVEYGIDPNDVKKESFTPNGDIKFDILSCNKVLSEDEIGVNLTINNSSGKNVSVIIYNDANKRVKIASKSSNVSVVNK